MKCSVCGRKIRIRKDGKVSRHRNPLPEKHWSYWCLGGNKPPKEDDTPVPNQPAS